MSGKQVSGSLRKARRKTLQILQMLQGIASMVEDFPGLGCGVRRVNVMMGYGEERSVDIVWVYRKDA